MKTQRAERIGHGAGLIARALHQNPPAHVPFLTQNPKLKTQNCRQEATCLGCGCTDSHACLPLVGDPCHWLKVDYKLGIGVCSECEHKMEEFKSRIQESESRRTA